MVTQMYTHAEMEDMKNIFVSMDKDGSGTLSKEELISGEK